MQDDALTTLIESSDLDGLVRHVDGLVTARDWSALTAQPSGVSSGSEISPSLRAMMLRFTALKSSKPRDLDSYREGRDELNLAEFPLATISDRFLDGTKTVVICGQVWDRDRREHVPRKLAISGSDR